jgi:hypothetical protein
MNDLLDNNKSCPYYQLINIIKYYNHQKNNLNQNGKYSSISNNNQSLQNNINSQKYNINIIQKNKSFYYYDPFPSLQSPILLIALISFHHKKGSIIEYSFPPKESLHKNSNISYLIENKNISIEKFVEDLFQKLTYICLPDGIHCTKSDTQFFIIQDYNYPLYGISCYEQIKSQRDDTIENTRNFIQKSLCILTIIPLYSPLYAKLSVTLETFFNQTSLKDKNIINDLYQNFFLDGETNFRLDEMNFVFASRKLLCFTKEKIFLILKMILLEKRILIFSNISGNVCSFLYNLLVLNPGQILFNLKNGNDIKNYLKHLKFYGLPLKIFHENYKIYPLVSLYEIDQIEQEKNVNYIMGTTNQLIWNETFEKKKVDLMINIDKMEIIPFYKKDNKDILEYNKEEKDIFANIENKLNDNNVTYNNTNWLNSNEIDDEIDDFIRNEFVKYFKDILIKLSLIQNLINKNNIVRYLNIPKIDNLYSQSILDEKAIKSILKKLIPNPNNISFLLLFSKTKSFQYWLSDVSENLFYLSPYITSDKSITIFLEDGNTYIGTLSKGLFDGFGTLSSLDNKYLYTGEWKDGLKHGKGQLITEKIKYSGKFENDVFSGNKGVLCDEKGNIYEGDFVNGKFEGYGHYKMSNGDNYIGQFKNGYFEGKGQLTDKKGNVFNGNFVRGQKDGFGLIVKSNGETIEGKYKNGIFFKIKNDNHDFL